MVRFLSVGNRIINFGRTNINSNVPLNFIMMLTEQHHYIGEVLNIYKQAASSRYGSTASSLSYLALSTAPVDF